MYLYILFIKDVFVLDFCDEIVERGQAFVSVPNPGCYIGQLSHSTGSRKYEITAFDVAELVAVCYWLSWPARLQEDVASSAGGTQERW